MALENLTQQLTSGSAMGIFANMKPWVIALIVLSVIWKLVWYAIALYKSGARKQKSWFVILFICTLFLNDLGVLPILYLIFIKERKIQKVSLKKKK